MLELDGLRRSFGDTLALDDLSFAAHAGRMLGFVGPNGAGKTTAMRIVLGVLEPDAGAVRWRGRPVDAAARRRFGYMPEERGLYPKMRVRDQLVHFARLHGLDAAAARRGRRRAGSSGSGCDARRRPGRDALAGQPAARAARRRARARTGGARPRRAVLRPGSDRRGRMSGVLAERAQAGVPVVFSSHQLELVERLCEDVAIINGGRLVAHGAVESCASAAAAPCSRSGSGWRATAAATGSRPSRARRSAAQEPRGLLVRLPAGSADRRPARRGARRGDRDPLRARAPLARRPLPPGGGSVSGPGKRRLASSLRGTRGREAVRLIARREIVVRARERSFLVGRGSRWRSSCSSRCCPTCSASGGATATRSPRSPRPRSRSREAAVAVGEALDADVTVESGAAVGDVDAALTARRDPRAGRARRQAGRDPAGRERRVRSGEALRQAGVGERAARAALSPPPLRVRTDEPGGGRGPQRLRLLRRAAALRAADRDRLLRRRRRRRGEVLPRGRGPARDREARPPAGGQGDRPGRPRARAAARCWRWPGSRSRAGWRAGGGRRGPRRGRARARVVRRRLRLLRRRVRLRRLAGLAPGGPAVRRSRRSR